MIHKTEDVSRKIAGAASLTPGEKSLAQAIIDAGADPQTVFSVVLRLSISRQSESVGAGFPRSNTGSAFDDVANGVPVDPDPEMRSCIAAAMEHASS